MTTNSFLHEIALKDDDLLQGRNRHFAPPFLAMQGELSLLGNLFPKATILLFNSEGKSSCHDHCFEVETRQLKHKTAN